MRHEAAAIAHEREAAAAMSALLRYEGRPSSTFNRAEWALASDTLIRTRDRQRAYRTLCDVLARRRPARPDFARDMRAEIGRPPEEKPLVLDNRPTSGARRERRLFVPPPFVRSTAIGRASPRRTPQQDDASAARFVNSETFRASPAGAQYHPEIAARAELRAQDSRQRARDRQAAVLPDTPQHRAFAGRGYASFGNADQVAIGARMVATVEALQAAAPHLLATSAAGRAAGALFAMIGRYNKGRATNGELDKVLKDMMFATPPATHHHRTGAHLAVGQQAADRWATATASAHALLTAVHDVDLQLELDQRARQAPRPGRGAER